MLRGGSAGVLAALAVLGVATLARAQGQSDGVIELEAGQFLQDERAAPPPDDADPRWQPVRIPDVWRDSRPGAEGSGWYRFEVPRPARADARFGIYAEAELTAAVFLNGEWLGQCGRVEPPYSHCWNRPLYFAFAASRLDRETNVVHVRLLGKAWSGSRLTRVRFGPDEALAPLYARQFFLRIRVPEATTWFGIALTVFIGVLWLARRHESVYGWLALAALLRTVNNLNYHVLDFPLPYWAWQHVTHAALDGFGLAGIVTTYRLLGVRRPGLERVLALQAGLVVALPLLVPRRAFGAVVLGLHGVTVALLLVAIVLLVLELRGRRRTEVRVVLGCALVAFGIGLHDLLAQARILDVPFRLIPYTAPLLLLTGAGILLARFLREYRRAESLNVELEARVAEKHAELERNFARTRSLEAERVLAAERDRLMREVHDGIGGQLVSALAMVESGVAARGELADALRDALDEMRVVLQSLDPLVEDLPSLLAILRSRLEPRLAPHGLRFEWRVRDLPPMPELGHDGFLHVLRIVQESITNVVKHAKARVITVSTGLRPAADGRLGVFVCVRDDGVGLRAKAGSGRGLENMRRRAAEIGAELALSDAGHGTAVDLWIPLDGSGAATPRA